MPLGGLVIGGIGLAAAAGAGAAGVGKNTFRSADFADTSRYDPNAQLLGGKAGLAGNMAQGYGNTANAAAARDSPEARAAQVGSLGLLQQAAQGNAPSAAAIQQTQGMNQALANQQAMANSARGPAGLAMAQQNAAGNAAAMQQGAFTSGAALRAQEMAQARGAYSGASDAFRNADLMNRAQNDTTGLAYNQMANETLQRERAAAQANQMMLAQSHQNADSINAGINGANAGHEMDTLKMGLGAVQGGASMGMSGMKGPG